MIDTMGRPEQLEEETTTEPSQKQTHQEDGNHGKEAGGIPGSKRLTRNKNDKLIGGVCSGIANYFKIDPAIVRVLTFLLILAYGIGLMAYIVLWIILPGDDSADVGLRKRLYRDTDHRVIGGVASGIAAYFKIDIVIPRIVFVLPLFGMIFSSIFSGSFHRWDFYNVFFPFSVSAFPTLFVLYIVLWIVVPKAVTQAEKLEMKGERVDLQSLSNAYKSTDDEKKKLSSEPPADSPSPKRKKHSGPGEVFGILVKIFLYFILGIVIVIIGGVLIGLTGGFLGIMGLSSAMFPLKSILLSTALQKILVWPAVVLTLGVPVVALIWLLIRLITGFRSRSRFAGLSFLGLWIIGVVCAISLVVFIVADFRMRYSKGESVDIIQPQRVLVLKKAPTTGSFDNWNENIGFVKWNGWLDDFIGIGEDSIRIKYVRLSVGKSRDSNFHAHVVRFSNGPSIARAKHYTQLMNYRIYQKDSVLFVSDAFVIPKNVPFRNQHIVLKIEVPGEKHIVFRDGLEKLQKEHFRQEEWEWDKEEDDSDWYESKQYVLHSAE